MSSSSFSIILNGSPHGNLKPSRGLCQGDLLSPYIFILYTKILSSLMLREENRRRLKGIKLGREVSSILHMLFVDDLFFFARVITRETIFINECLEKYMMWYGQKLNNEKS